MEKPQVSKDIERASPVVQQKIEEVQIRQHIPQVVPTEMTVEVKKELDKPLELFSAKSNTPVDDAVPLLNLVVEEEAPEISFLKYMDQEVNNPKFSNTTVDEMELPSVMNAGEEGVTVQETAQAASNIVRDSAGLKATSHDAG